MPRTRQPQAVQIAKQLGKLASPQVITMTQTQAKGRTKRGRPTKVRKADFENVIITPVANGYIVQSVTAGENLFVFEDMDSAFDFIRVSLKTTAEQTEVLESI